jgi:predicted nuclease with TOPRIM domain
MARSFYKALPLTYNACENEAISAYFDGIRDGSRHGWQAAGKTGETPGWEVSWEEEDEEDPQVEEALNRVATHIQGASKRFMELLQDLELETAAEARALWEAFSNFSRKELGLEPKKLVKFWFQPALSEIEELEALTKAVELDREKVEESEGYIRAGWQRLVEG